MHVSNNSDALEIPADEKRILGLMEKTRLDKIRRHAAARLIQQAWKKYLFAKAHTLDHYCTHGAIDRYKVRQNQF